MLLEQSLPDGEHEGDVVLEVVGEMLVGLLPVGVVMAEGGGGVAMLLHSFLSSPVGTIVADLVLRGDEALGYHFVGSMPFDFGKPEGSGRFGSKLSPKEGPEVAICLDGEGSSWASVVEEVLLDGKGFGQHAHAVCAYVHRSLPRDGKDGSSKLSSSGRAGMPR